MIGWRDKTRYNWKLLDLILRGISISISYDKQRKGRISISISISISLTTFIKLNPNSTFSSERQNKQVFIRCIHSFTIFTPAFWLRSSERVQFSSLVFKPFYVTLRLISLRTWAWKLSVYMTSLLYYLHLRKIVIFAILVCPPKLIYFDLL